MRAIILAAGMGTRLRPLTENIPKALVEVNGKPMLERQIEFLNEKGIKEIIILTGYLKEKFEYIKKKYPGVKLVYNDKYAEFNNIYSMYLVGEYLRDAYVLEGDVYLTRNFLKTSMNNSAYFTGEKQGFKDEWILKFNENYKVYDIEVGSGTGCIMSGVSYWSSEDGEFIINKLNKIIESGNFKELYWDNVVKANLNNLNIKIEKISPKDWYEIDTLVDLNKINKTPLI